MNIALNILGLFLIFFARIADVSCSIVRILFLVKGQRFYAACIGFFEVMIYMTVLGYLLGGGNTLSLVELMFYCGGFATGNYIGAWLEERLLNSYLLVEVILDDDSDARASVENLRGMGLGATIVNGMGRSGPKLVVEVFCRRHDVATIQKLYDHKGFVTISDVRRCMGGWFPKRL